MNDASPNSPRSGETVSDAEAYNQILRQKVGADLDYVADVIGGYAGGRSHDLDELAEDVHEARVTLELVEAVLEQRKEESDE